MQASTQQKVHNGIRTRNLREEKTQKEPKQCHRHSESTTGFEPAIEPAKKTGCHQKRRPSHAKKQDATKRKGQHTPRHRMPSTQKRPKHETKHKLPPATKKAKTATQCRQQQKKGQEGPKFPPATNKGQKGPHSATCSKKRPKRAKIATSN